MSILIPFENRIHRYLARKFVPILVFKIVYIILNESTASAKIRFDYGC
jgi:hypothetical protein